MKMQRVWKRAVVSELIVLRRKIPEKREADLYARPPLIIVLSDLLHLIINSKTDP